MICRLANQRHPVWKFDSEKGAGWHGASLHHSGIPFFNFPGILPRGLWHLIGAGGGFLLMPLLLLIYPNEHQRTLTAIALAVVFLNPFPAPGPMPA